MMGPEQYAWLCSPQGLSAWRAMFIPSIDSPVHPTDRNSIAKLDRKCLDLLNEQALLADKARRKVDEPHRWFWTKNLLEQASDEWTARETALDAPMTLARWLDVCCGAGVDSIAMARRRPGCTGIDRNPIALRLAQANSSMNQVEVDWSECEAETIALDPDTYLHIDPDRRSEGLRTIDPFHSQPAWPWIADATRRCGAVSLKLAPGLRVDEGFDWRDAHHPNAIRWLSWDGSVRQQRWYWGLDRWPDGSRVASSGRRNQGWHHEVFPFSSIHAAGHAVNAVDEVSKLKSGWIGDQDPVVRAASVGGCLAERLGVACIGDRNGYYHSPEPVLHPMLQWFRIIEVESMDSKKIRSIASRLSARQWELKSRGVDIDLTVMQRQLRVDSNSDQTLTILFTRIGKKHVAVFAHRIPKESV